MIKISFIIYLIFSMASTLESRDITLDSKLYALDSINIKSTNEAESSKDSTTLKLFLQFSYLSKEDGCRDKGDRFLCANSVAFLKAYNKDGFSRYFAYDIQWAALEYDEDIPYYIYMFFMHDNEDLYTDSEDKGLCYSFYYGCLFPYTPNLKSDTKIYAMPNDSKVIYTSKALDLGFVIAEGEEFYQVIILKGYKGITSYQSFDRITQNMDFINGFVKKSDLKDAMKNNHKLFRIDTFYNDKPLFSTPPIAKELDSRLLDSSKEAK